jgi:hypothetical protein
VTAADVTGGAGVITRTWLRWEGYQPRLERDVFATTEPASIAAAVDAFCRAELGGGIDHYEFYFTGIGSTHGLCLDDGRRVVVKVHRATSDVAHLAAVQKVQSHLAADGFPAPQPLLGPAPLANGIAVVEMLLDRGAWGDAHKPEIRKLVAGGLFRQIDLCRELVGLPGLESSWSVIRRYWQRPHDRRFDFPATSGGAEWIERLAAEALRRLDEGGQARPPSATMTGASSTCASPAAIWWPPGTGTVWAPGSSRRSWAPRHIASRPTTASMAWTWCRLARRRWRSSATTRRLGAGRSARMSTARQSRR